MEKYKIFFGKNQIHDLNNALLNIILNTITKYI